jgi:YebC/PmpR family DNA-binding regulatory protein
MLIQVVTSNRNRIVGEFRHLISKNGGNMAEAGAVGWMFHRKGEINIPKESASEDKLLDIVLEAGAEDMKDEGSSWYIVTPPESLEAVKEALGKAGIKPASAELGMVPQNYIKLTGQQASQMLRLVEALEEHDDVQHVYANFDIDESEIQAAVGAN